MISAYVLIKAEMKRLVNGLLRRLEKVNGVREVHTIYGTHDIIAGVEAETEGELNELLTYKIREMNGVMDTKTLKVVE